MSDPRTFIDREGDRFTLDKIENGIAHGEWDGAQHGPVELPVRLFFDMREENPTPYPDYADDEQFRKCPYCGEGEVHVSEDTDWAGNCPACLLNVTFEGPEDESLPL